MSIEGAVRDSAARQVAMHRVEGGVWIVLGAIFAVLAVFVKGKADEQAARVGAGIVGVLLVAGGAAYVKTMTARVATLVELLLHRRSELRSPEIIALRRRGVFIAYVISVRDATGRKYRMRTSSEADARAMLANVPP